MKTKHVLTLSMCLLIIAGATEGWAQGRGRGNDNGRRGKSEERIQPREQSRDHRQDGYRDQYSYRDKHHHETRVVHVHRARPVERVVVVHHHHHRPERQRYVYYRDYDVYYDYDRSVYITFTGRNWAISREVPIRMYYADRNNISAIHVAYYNDDLPGYLDSHRPGGRACDQW